MIVLPDVSCKLSYKRHIVSSNDLDLGTPNIITPSPCTENCFVSSLCSPPVGGIGYSVLPRFLCSSLLCSLLKGSFYDILFNCMTVVSDVYLLPISKSLPCVK